MSNGVSLLLAMCACEQWVEKEKEKLIQWLDLIGYGRREGN